MRSEAARLTNDPLGSALVPKSAIESLWLFWGDAFPPADDGAKFNARYGFFDAPYANALTDAQRDALLEYLKTL